MAINMAAYVRGVESLMCCARARYFLRRLQRYVHGVEREVEKERLRAVSLDEPEQTAGHGFAVALLILERASAILRAQPRSRA